jgi:AraC family cel operon transcriptional repressor
VQRAFYPPGFVFAQHRHEYAELFLVEQGPGLHQLGSRFLPLDEGDLVLVHPDLAHALAATRERPLVFVNVAIRLELFQDLASRYPELASVWTPSPRPPLRLDRAARRSLIERLGELESEAGGRISDRLRLEALLHEILLHVRDRKGPREALPAPLARMLEELERPEHLRAGVSGLAKRVGWTREHLTRQVRRHLGTSAHALVVRHRLEHAAELLARTDLPIETVCERSGMDGLSNFYRQFRTRFGCTPAQFRKANGNRMA